MEKERTMYIWDSVTPYTWLDEGADLYYQVVQMTWNVHLLEKTVNDLHRSYNEFLIKGGNDTVRADILARLDEHIPLREGQLFKMRELLADMKKVLSTGCLTYQFLWKTQKTAQTEDAFWAERAERLQEMVQGDVECDEAQKAEFWGEMRSRMPLITRMRAEEEALWKGKGARSLCLICEERGEYDFGWETRRKRRMSSHPQLVGICRKHERGALVRVANEHTEFLKWATKFWEEVNRGSRGDGSDRKGVEGEGGAAVESGVAAEAGGAGGAGGAGEAGRGNQEVVGGA